MEIGSILYKNPNSILSKKICIDVVLSARVDKMKVYIKLNMEDLL